MKDENQDSGALEVGNAVLDAARIALGDLRETWDPRTVDDWVGVVDRAIQSVGEDHVALGSDFDGIGCAPERLDSVDKWPNLTRALLEEGYTAAEIRKIQELVARLAEAREAAKK